MQKSLLGGACLLDCLHATERTAGTLFNEGRAIVQGLVRFAYLYLDIQALQTLGPSSLHTQDAAGSGASPTHLLLQSEGQAWMAGC